MSNLAFFFRMPSPRRSSLCDRIAGLSGRMRLPSGWFFKSCPIQSFCGEAGIEGLVFEKRGTWLAGLLKGVCICTGLWKIDWLTS